MLISDMTRYLLYILSYYFVIKRWKKISYSNFVFYLKRAERIVKKLVVAFSV